MKSKVYKGVCEICQKTVSYYYLEKHMLRKHQDKTSSFSVNEKDKSISNPPNMKPKRTIASKSKIVKKTRLKKSKAGKMVSNLQTNEVDIEIKEEMENQESNVDIFSGDVSNLSGEIGNFSDRVTKVKEEQLSSVAQWYISQNKGVPIIMNVLGKKSYFTL